MTARFPLLRPVVIACNEMRQYGTGGRREHPYDRLHGVHTSGTMPSYVVKPGDPLDAPSTTGYVPAQPSIIRTAFAVIPDQQHCHFLDLGCGKGRALLVASEFGFADITGVELVPALARIARRNAARFSRLYPDRTRINIVTGDALAHPLPEAKLVIFLYNPFGQSLITQLLARVEASLGMVPRDLYIVYYKPAWAGIFDASTSLERRYAAEIPCDPGEIDFTPDPAGVVVIWQNRGNPHPRPAGAVAGIF